jgi:hypothetical protein
LIIAATGTFARSARATPEIKKAGNNRPALNLFLNFITPTLGAPRIGNIDVVENPMQARRLVVYLARAGDASSSPNGHRNP